MQESKEKVARYEVAHTKMNRVCRFLPKTELPQHTGYRSVYGFDDLAISYFEEVGSTRGCKNIVTAVYADEMLLDFDEGVGGYDAKAEAEKLWHWLVGHEYSFQVWDSGGRSIHFHIPHEPVWSKHLPYSHKCFMDRLGVKSDESIFQTGRLFRLPGTLHEKTLRKKTLLESAEGKLLVVPIIEEPPRQRLQACFDGEGVLHLATRLSMVANRPFQNGERNRKFFCLAMDVLSGGFSSDFCRELCEKVNDELLEEPLDEQELNMVIDSAIQSAGG